MRNSQALYGRIIDEIHRVTMSEFILSTDREQHLLSQKIEEIISREIKSEPPHVQKRIRQEYNSWGPICELLQDEGITEILVNGPESIWFERNGRLSAHADQFYSELSFRNFLDRLRHAANTHITTERPCGDGRFGDFRLSLIGPELTGSNAHLALRRHPKNPWSFSKLAENNWCTDRDLETFKKMAAERKNILIVGTTGSGKTSILNSFLSLIEPNERAVIIEDASEIALPNKVSLKLLTREDPQGILPPVDQSQLVKSSLRLRPDRLVMGEVRGSEAKDFLMALSTGHSGSYGTLHAADASQALLRLEMLIQIGAPHWSLSAIRRLIQLSLDYIVVTEKKETGNRGLKGTYRICSLEENGLLIEPVK